MTRLLPCFSSYCVKTLLLISRSIAAVIARMKAAKSEVMKRQMDLLKER